jgi:hypothetical protein
MKETTIEHLWCAMKNRALAQHQRDALADKYRRQRRQGFAANLRHHYRTNGGQF